MPSLHLRPAVPEDAGELLSIYRPYVEHTAVTFEYAVPTPAQFTQRVRDTLATHPYLVAEAEGTLRGISQPVIKAHGSSNAYAFFNAIRQAQVVAQADIVGDIAANVAHMRLEPGEKEG